MTSESSPRASEHLGPAPERQGDFVRLRRLTPDDAQITLGWRTSVRARRLNSGATTVEHQARWIGSRPGDEFNYIIELQDGAPIGMLSLVGIDLANGRAESARFLIGDEEAAKGAPVAVEAMKLLYEIAFDELGLQRIHGLVAEPNTLMIKWQKYLGMREEGRLRRHYFMGGTFVDAIALGLLEEEYRRVTTPRMKALMQMGRAPKGSA